VVVYLSTTTTTPTTTTTTTLPPTYHLPTYPPPYLRPYYRLAAPPVDIARIECQFNSIHQQPPSIPSISPSPSPPHTLITTVHQIKDVRFIANGCLVATNVMTEALGHRNHILRSKRQECGYVDSSCWYQSNPRQAATFPDRFDYLPPSLSLCCIDIGLLADRSRTPESESCASYTPSLAMLLPNSPSSPTTHPPLRPKKRAFSRKMISHS